MIGRSQQAKRRKIAHTSVQSDRSEPISALEKLPRELTSMILDFAIETVFEMRTVSRAMKSHVDGFATHRLRRPLVEEISFHGTEEEQEAKDPGDVTVSIVVPARYVALFELRLLLNQRLLGERFRPNFKAGRRRLRHQISRTSNAGTRGDGRAYHASLNVIRIGPQGDSFWEYLVACIGDFVERAGLVECRHRCTELDACVEYLERFKFSKLSFRSNAIDRYTVKTLLAIIDDRDIHSLSLCLKEVKTWRWNAVQKVREPRMNSANFLLELASRLTSLQITQEIDFDNKRGRQPADQFMDSYKNWGTVFVKMFSRKLDKLRINNNGSRMYMNLANANWVKYRLAEMDKKVWFKATCIMYPEGLNYTHKGNVVKADRVIANADEACEPCLSVIHTSRVNETDF